MGQDGGNVHEPALVPGDIFLFQAGDTLPADAVLLPPGQAEIDEFDLTGELSPVIRKAGDRILAGTTVVSGKGSARVTAVGEASEFGRILTERAGRWGKEREYWRKSWPTAWKRTLPVQILLAARFLLSIDRAEGLATLLAWAVQAAGVFGVGWLEAWRAGMQRWFLRRLRQKRYVVLNPEVLDLLGQVDVCCFDKTGILTTRQMAVSEVVSPSLDGGRDDRIPVDTPLFQRVAEGCLLAHQSQDGQYFGLRPVDTALHEYGRKIVARLAGPADYGDSVVEIPFLPVNRYSVVSAQVSGKRRIWLKGALEVVLPRCRCYQLDSGEKAPMSGEFLLAVRQAEKEWFAQGKTVLALAEKEGEFSSQETAKYNFLVLIILENSLRKEARSTVGMLSERKIRSLILTGDTAFAAKFTGVSLGIAGPDAPLLTGPVVERMSLADITAQSRYVSLFARLTPSCKGLVIEALKRQGKCVLMFGDGTNDAIALRLAQVAVSLQSESTALARRNAAILSPEDLRSLPRLIDIGRIYRNWLRRMPRLHGASLALFGVLQLLNILLPISPLPNAAANLAALFAPLLAALFVARRL